MKKLSDYKGDEAIELWADLIEPIAKILADKTIADTYKSGKPKILLAKEILKTHKKEAADILLRIDPAPLNGLNIIMRLIEVLLEIEGSEELRGFFGTAGKEKTLSESSGCVTENTGDVEV